MPAAPMLACAARASDAACCDAAARSASPRRCWAEPWYACTPAKRRPPSAARARPRAARAGRRPPPAQRRSGPGRRRPRRRRRSSLPRRRRSASREPLDALDRIDRDREPDALGERGDARQLGGVDHLVRDVDVVDAGRGERLGLARLLDADADRAGRLCSVAMVALLCIFACGRRRTPCCARTPPWRRDCAPSRRGRRRARACRSIRPDRRRGGRAGAVRLVVLTSRGPLMSPPGHGRAVAFAGVVERRAVEVRGVAPADQGEALAGEEQPVDRGVAELPRARRLEAEAGRGAVQAVEHAAVR